MIQLRAILKSRPTHLNIIQMFIRHILCTSCPPQVSWINAQWVVTNRR